MIYLIRDIHEERQQRVAVYVIFCVPVRYDAIGKRVETCYMEGLDKEFVIILCNLRELAVVFDDSQGIEGTCYDECDEC